MNNGKVYTDYIDYVFVFRKIIFCCQCFAVIYNNTYNLLYNNIAYT